MAEPVRPQTTEELASKLRALNEQMATVTAEIVKRMKRIGKLREKQNADEVTQNDLEYRIAQTTNCLFARTVPLSNKLLTARHALITKLQLLSSDQITVAKQLELRSEVKADLSALQALCPHPFVFSYDGYEGSQHNDFDDQRYGNHLCTLCNFGESSQSTKEDVYRVLVRDNTRLIRRDLRKPPLKWFEQEWFSVEFLRQLFEHSAGGINIKWPTAVDKNSLFKFSKVL